MKTALVVVSLLMVNCSLLLGMENHARHIVNRESEQFKNDWIDYIQWSRMDKDYKGYALDCIKNNTDGSGKLLWQNARRDIESLKKGVPIAQGPALWYIFVSTYSFLLTLYMNMSTVNHYGSIPDFGKQWHPCKELDSDALRTVTSVLALLNVVFGAYEFDSSVKFDVNRRVRPNYFSDNMRMLALASLAFSGAADIAFACSADPSFDQMIKAMLWLKTFTVFVPLDLIFSTCSPDREDSGCTQLLQSCARKGRFLLGSGIYRRYGKLNRIIKFCDEYSKKES